MKLPFSLFKKDTPKSYYLALLLHDESVRAVIFEEEAGEMQVVNQHETLLSPSLEEIGEEGLLEACDKAISTAESILPQNIETHKTIFGLKESWVDTTNIKKERLTTLKKLCDELSLQPLGFLVFSEAIAHLLQKKEGAPISGVLLELGKHIFTVTLLRAGRIIEVKQAPMSTLLPQAVDALLQEFTNVEILPSRIIVFDPQRQPKLSQSFIHHQWTKTLPFLHMPQITSLEEGFDTQAILYGTASQMGFSMSSLPIPPRDEPSTVGKGAEKNHQDETKIEKKSEETIPVDEEKIQEQEEQEEIPATIADAQDFGFVQGKDVLEDAPRHPHIPPHFAGDNFTTSEPMQAFEEIPEEVKDEEEGITKGTVGANATFLAEGAKQVQSTLRTMKFSLAGFFSKKNEPSNITTPEPQRTQRRKFSPLLLLIPLILLVILAGALWYIFGVSATISLTLTPNVVTNTGTVTFSATNSTDAANNLIGSSQVTVDESGSSSTTATGTKDIGDKAKGSVTIYNLSDSSQAFPSGTTITASNGLKFTLDNAITVASGSSDPINPVAGKATVNVTASDIGTDYNLPSGTKFSLGKSGNVAAQNTSAMSGGTKKSITVIAQSDVDKLTNDLTDQLKGKAQSDLAAKADSSKGILPVFLKTTLSQQSLDNKVGTQATTVALHGTITFTGISYQKSDLDSIAKSALSGKIDQNKLTSQGIKEDIGDATVKDTTVKSQVTFKASLLPQVDTANLEKELAGKSYAQAQNILAGIPQYDDMHVQLSPQLFFLPHILPKLSTHIHIVVISQ